MTFEEYETRCGETALYPATPAVAGKVSLYPVLGLVGEAGEIAEKTKKLIRDKGNTLDESSRQEIGKELGDVLWYLCRCANEFGFSFDEIARRNIEKLSSRKERNVLHGDGDNR